MAELFKGEARAENRKHARLKLRLWVHFIMHQADRKIPNMLESLTEDLGAGGMALRSDHQLQPGQILHLILFIPKKEKRESLENTLIYTERDCLPVNITAVVRWCNTKEKMEYIMGVEFLEVESNHIERLMSFLQDYSLMPAEQQQEAME